MPPTAGELPNIAWDTLTDQGLTLWGGHYSDNPSPAIADARVLARWPVDLEIRSMAASPDGRYLAILTVVRCRLTPPKATPTPVYVDATPVALLPPDGEPCIDPPRFLYVVDLLANSVRPIPDYSNYALYAQYGPYSGRSNEVMGWLDNDRIALDAGQLLVATRDGSSFQYRNFPNLTGRDHLFIIQLLPDRETMFVWVNDEFYLRDVHSGDIRKVGNRSQDRAAGYGIIKASPNGQSIGYVGPDVQGGEINNRHLNLSFQRFSDDSRHLLVAGGVWDPRPAWSPDSSSIAFARTTAVPAGDNASIFESEKADTNIYVATIDGLKIRQLTSFSGAHNRDIRWTPAGNLLLAATYGSSDKTFGLVWVSATDGSAVRLWTPPPGETFAMFTLFDLQTPGMPPAGVEPARP